MYYNVFKKINPVPKCLKNVTMTKVVMLLLSGLNGQAGSCVLHSEWFRSVLSSSCTQCTHKTSLFFIFISTPPSLPCRPHDNKTANRAVWSYSVHLGQQQRPNLPPLSPSLLHPPSRKQRDKEKGTGPKGCNFSRKPCCLQYLCELNMYGALTQPCYSEMLYVRLPSF